MRVRKLIKSVAIGISSLIVITLVAAVALIWLGPVAISEKGCCSIC
jgi:hypothetical protein